MTSQNTWYRRTADTVHVTADKKSLPDDHRWIHRPARKNDVQSGRTKLKIDIQMWISCHVLHAHRRPSYWGKHTNWIILYCVLESVWVNKWQNIKPEIHETWIHSLQNVHILHFKQESPSRVGTPVVLLYYPAKSYSAWNCLHPPLFHIYGIRRVYCIKRSIWHTQDLKLYSHAISQRQILERPCDVTPFRSENTMEYLASAGFKVFIAGWMTNQFSGTKRCVTGYLVRDVSGQCTGLIFEGLKRNSALRVLK
jgi:hypothetical protein